MQPAKENLSRKITDPGIETDLGRVRLGNAEDPIPSSVEPVSNVTVWRERQPVNTNPSKMATDGGRQIDSSGSHF
jgi:hypothetical protein